MGNGDSKVSSSSSEGKGSRRARFKERLHLGHYFHHDRRRRNGDGSSGSSSSILKLISADNFAGIALLTLIRAEMKFRDKWIACLSLGEQAFRTKTSDQLSPGKASWTCYCHFSSLTIHSVLIKKKRRRSRYSIQSEIYDNDNVDFIYLFIFGVGFFCLAK